jgi:hypothetical protein
MSLLHNSNKKPASHSGCNCKQSASRQYGDSYNCSTANYDRVQWCSIRWGQNSGHYQNCIKFHKKLATRIHRTLKVIAFNANGIWRQHYELSKQLQDLHVDVALFSVTQLKPHERFFIPNYHFIEPTATRAEKAELPLQLE